MKKTIAPKLSNRRAIQTADATFAVIDLQWAFNEWMRRYIANPEEFMREFQTVSEFQKSKSKPNYGKDCTGYIAKLLTERYEKRSKRAR